MSNPHMCSVIPGNGQSRTWSLSPGEPHGAENTEGCPHPAAGWWAPIWFSVSSVCKDWIMVKEFQKGLFVVALLLFPES